MCKQIKLKIKRRNHGEFPDHNVPVSIEAESVTGYFSAVPIHDEGVPGQFVMHPKDNVTGTNDIAVGKNYIVTCFHELVTVLSISNILMDQIKRGRRLR